MNGQENLLGFTRYLYLRCITEAVWAKFDSSTPYSEGGPQGFRKFAVRLVNEWCSHIVAGTEAAFLRNIGLPGSCAAAAGITAHAADADAAAICDAGGDGGEDVDGCVPGDDSACPTDTDEDGAAADDATDDEKSGDEADAECVDN